MTTPDDMLSSLIAVIETVFMIDGAGLNASSTANDVAGWDSVSQVMLIMQIEDELGVILEVNDVNEAQDLGALAALLVARSAAGGSRNAGV